MIQYERYIYRLSIVILKDKHAQIAARVAR